MSSYFVSRTRIRHWLPILTFCPVNNLPDLVYFEVEFESEQGTVHELYEIRKLVRKLTSMRKNYMEDLALRVLLNIPDVKAVTVRLAFNRHEYRVERTNV